MKKIFFAAVAALALVACSGEKSNPNAYTINGIETGADGETVYLIDGRDTLGVETVQNGAFTFKGDVETPKAVRIFISTQLNSQSTLSQVSSPLTSQNVRLPVLRLTMPTRNLTTSCWLSTKPPEPKMPMRIA